MLTLRRMAELPYTNGTVQVDWWREEFDAVVVATFPGEMDAAWVPPIPGLDSWANAFPDHVWHGREYRTSAGFGGKVRAHPLRMPCAYLTHRPYLECTHHRWLTYCIRNSDRPDLSCKIRHGLPPG